jgi:hypothetical protein
VLAISHTSTKPLEHWLDMIARIRPPPITGHGRKTFMRFTEMQSHNREL